MRGREAEAGKELIVRQLQLLRPKLWNQLGDAERQHTHTQTPIYLPGLVSSSVLVHHMHSHSVAQGHCRKGNWTALLSQLAWASQAPIAVELSLGKGKQCCRSLHAEWLLAQLLRCLSCQFLHFKLAITWCRAATALPSLCLSSTGVSKCKRCIFISWAEPRSKWKQRRHPRMKFQNASLNSYSLKGFFFLTSSPIFQRVTMWFLKLKVLRRRK